MKELITAENLESYLAQNPLRSFKANKKPVLNTFVKAFYSGSCMSATGICQFEEGNLLCITDPNDIYPVSQEKYDELYEEVSK